MGILVTAIITASLLGSLHCVGMCGPLAIWASGAGERVGARRMAMATTWYHLGRLLTYALAGGLAGAAGQLLDTGGHALGVQLLAARLVGGLMITVGMVRLGQIVWQHTAAWRMRSAVPPTGRLQSALPQSTPIQLTPRRPGLLTRGLLRLRPFVFRLPLAARGLVTGLLTALLPCGWLYLFALVAAGTGRPHMGALVMAAFWLGSVPALVGLVTGAQALGLRFRRLLPAGAAVLLIVGGGYTAAGRGFAQLNSLSDIRLSGPADLAVIAMPTAAAADGPGHVERAEQIEQALAELTHTPLPCCAAHAAAAGEVTGPTAAEPADAEPPPDTGGELPAL